ncbi:MAG: ABC transporter ATP-binding protein, partial [Fimbriimonadaceae bacterium]
MPDLLVLDGFSPLPQGPTLSLSLASGKSLCIVGPAGGGKTRFLRTAFGLERIGQGRATTNSPVAYAGQSEWPRRATPLSIVKRVSGPKRASLAGEAVYSTGLWDCQNTSVDDLSSTQRCLAELLSCLSSEPGIMVVDSQFDQLDPWSLKKVMEAFQKRLNVGYGLIVVTNRPELAVYFDHLVVMQASGIRFVGT